MVVALKRMMVMVIGSDGMVMDDQHLTTGSGDGHNGCSSW